MKALLAREKAATKMLSGKVDELITKTKDDRSTI